ncbi:hypothetical protein [Tolypothrix sp. VBCCA 56010]|uniref:hypothetical protein n=1 Tax=Tolypothrix sp. VBCCA 56010 TaxID=3137731 RepID=UPI003D7EF6A4
MICPFCRCEFDLADSPIECPACGYEMPDMDATESEEVFSLIQTEEKVLKVVEGYQSGNVFFGSFDECFALMLALDVPI